MANTTFASIRARNFPSSNEYAFEIEDVYLSGSSIYPGHAVKTVDGTANMVILATTGIALRGFMGCRYDQDPDTAYTIHKHAPLINFKPGLVMPVIIESASGVCGYMNKGSPMRLGDSSAGAMYIMNDTEFTANINTSGLKVNPIGTLNETVANSDTRAFMRMGY